MRPNGLFELAIRACLALACALFVSVGAGCTPLPATAAQRGLYVDLRKAVELKQKAGGWIVDRLEVESQAATALRSYCQTDESTRTALALWLDQELARAGGPSRSIYERTHGNLEAASKSLTLERVRMLFDYARAHAEQDCPYWMRGSAEFAGVEGDAERWVMWFESMGAGSIVVEGDQAALGGGGGGRALLARGIGPRVTLAAGAEIGGAGAFVKNDRGGRTVDTTFIAALPVVLRVTDVSRVFDVELAPLVHFDPDQDILPPGLRAAVGAGITAQRGTTFMPYVVIWAGYELYPVRDGSPTQHSFRLGTRVGVDFDP